MSVTCRSCGEQISFVQTPKGRRMPVDGDELETFYLDTTTRGPDRIVLENGEVLTGRIVDAKTPGVTTVKGYTPHWQNCVDGDKFRK